MLKTRNIWIIGGVLLIIIFLFTQGKKEAVGSFSISAPAVVAPNSQFTVSYIATKSDQEWFVGWHDDITGCTPAIYENFLSRQTGDAETQTKLVTFTAPSSGECIFGNGYFEFTGETQQNLPTTRVEICEPVCTTICGGESDGCGGTCPFNDGSTCSIDSICKSGNCCYTYGDVQPCDTCISFNELMAYANKWILKQGPIFSDVMKSANAWVNRDKSVC